MVSGVIVLLPMDPDNTPEEVLNEIEEAFVDMMDRIGDDRIALRVLAEVDGTTYPAIVDWGTGEVLALLCIPPRTYAFGTVN